MLVFVYVCIYCVLLCERMSVSVGMSMSVSVRMSVSVKESGTRDVLLSILAKTKEKCAKKCDRHSRCIAFDFTGNEYEGEDEC